VLCFVILGGAVILGGLKLKSISMHIFVAYLTCRESD
jgi:hypothetical protein